MAAEQQSTVPVPAAAAPAAQPMPPGLGSDDEDVMDDIGSFRNLIKKLRDEMNELKKKDNDTIDNTIHIDISSGDNIGM